MRESFLCDICGRTIYVTPLTKYTLEKYGWMLYCSNCADKLHLSPEKAKQDKIKVYKVSKR